MQPKSKVLLTLWLRQIKSLTYTSSFRSLVYFILRRCPSLALLLVLPSGSARYQQPCWSNPRCFPPLILLLLLHQPAVRAITWWTPSRNRSWSKHPTKIPAGTRKQPGNARGLMELPVPVCPHQGKNHLATGTFRTTVPTKAFRKNEARGL